MAKHLRIKPSDKMSDAINNNAQILMSMSRLVYHWGLVKNGKHSASCVFLSKL